MTRYREILRLHSRGISQRGVAASCQCSRNTVAKVVARAKEMSISWPLKDELTDSDQPLPLFQSWKETRVACQVPIRSYSSWLEVSLGISGCLAD